jgi:hypothetical protein
MDNFNDIPKSKISQGKRKHSKNGIPFKVDFNGDQNKLKN